MKIQWKSAQVNKALLAVFTGVVGMAVITVVSARQAGAEWDFPGLWQQVQNHEGRIKNVEADVSDLQDSTGTPPSSNRVEVTPAPETTPSPDPIPESEPAPAEEPEQAQQAPPPTRCNQPTRPASCDDNSNTSTTETNNSH